MKAAYGPFVGDLSFLDDLSASLSVISGVPDQSLAAAVLLLTHLEGDFRVPLGSVEELLKSVLLSDTDFNSMSITDKAELGSIRE